MYSLAAEKGHFQFLKWLLIAKGDEAIKIIREQNLISYAIWSGNLPMVKWLIAQGAEVRTCIANVFIEMANSHNLKMLQYLIQQGVNPNITNAMGKTALMSACKNGHLKIVRYLLEFCLDINKKDLR